MQFLYRFARLSSLSLVAITMLSAGIITNAHADDEAPVAFKDKIMLRLGSYIVDRSNTQFTVNTSGTGGAGVIGTTIDYAKDLGGEDSATIPRLDAYYRFNDKHRIDSIRDFIIQDNFWTRPLRIEKHHQLVLDGHHSLELAKSLGLDLVPVIGFDYSEVEMWTLREEIPLDKQTVISHAKEGHVYPYKTVKHKFPNVECKCRISLKELTCD